MKKKKDREPITNINKELIQKLDEVRQILVKNNKSNEEIQNLKQDGTTDIYIDIDIDINMKNLFLEKINHVESLLNDKINVQKADRSTFQGHIDQAKQNLLFFDDQIKFNENKEILRVLFTHLNTIQKILNNNYPSYVESESELDSSTSKLITENKFKTIMKLSGCYFLQDGQRTYSFQKAKLRIIYTLLYLTGLKVGDLVYFTDTMIKKLLDNRIVEYISTYSCQTVQQKTQTQEVKVKVDLKLKDERMILREKDYSKEELLSFYKQIEADLEIVFTENECKYLGSNLRSKDTIGSFFRFGKMINKDLDCIHKEMNWNLKNPVTTQNFRYTFVRNMLRTRSLTDIYKENKKENINQYLDNLHTHVYL